MTSERHAASSPAVVQLASLRFYSHVFRSAGTSAIVTDLGGTITHANPAAERLFGYDPGELIGKDVADMVAPGSTPILFEQAEAANGYWIGTQQCQRKSGAIFGARLSVSVVRDERDEPVALLALSVDDTAHQRHRRRTLGLISVGLALSSDLNLTSLLRTVCHEARQLFNAHSAFVGLLDEEANEVVVMVADGRSADDIPGMRVSLEASHTATIRSVLERRPVIRHHIPSDATPIWFTRAFGSRAAMAAPLLRGDRVLGVLSLGDSEHPDRFAEDDARLLKSFGDLAAVAIENARLHQAERDRSAQLLSLAEVSQDLTASLEPARVYQAVARGAKRLLGADEVRVWLLDTSQGPFRLAFHDPPEEAPQEELTCDGSKLGEVLRTGKPWFTRDLRREERGFWFQFTLDRGLRAALMLPLTAPGLCLGGLALFWKRVRSFEPDELQLARCFAGQVAIAIRNTETLMRERQASQLANVKERASELQPRDRAHLDNLLALIERFSSLASEATSADYPVIQARDMRALTEQQND